MPGRGCSSRCSGRPSASAARTATTARCNGDGQVHVVAAFYPLAEAARQVGGDAVEVTDLTPAGAEPHDLELTPNAVDDLETADLVLVMGRDFQPALEDVAERRDGETVVVLDELPIDDGDDLDPHVWLDPQLMQEIVGTVEAASRGSHPSRPASSRATPRVMTRGWRSSTRTLPPA